MKRSLTHVSVTAGLGLWCVVGCSSILGIEDPPADETGSGGSSSGGKASASGGKSGGEGGDDGSGGGEEDGGRSSLGGGQSSGGRGGGQGSGGDDPGEVGGQGTGGTPSSPTVKGRIVDLFGRPLPNVEVRISGVDPGFTDEQGRFSVDSVAETYDAEFRTSSRSGYYQRIYRFVGLTRRDPTLQFDRDVGELEARIELAANNLPSPQVGNIGTGLGHPIDWFAPGDEGGLDNTSVAVVYDGDDPVTTELHAIFWKDAGVASDFYGFASQSIALNDVEDTLVTLSTWDSITEVGQLSGHISAPGTDPDVEVTAYAVFGDGASIPLQTVPWNSADQTFSLNVPNLSSEATYSVSAVVRDDGNTWGHADGFALNASATSINLELPRRPYLQAPLDEVTGVSSGTVLRWTPSDAGACSMLLINNGAWYRGVRIVTCDSEFTLTEDLVSFFLQDDELDKTLYWSVQAHGDPADVDEMTGDSGFFDPYFDNTSEGTYPRGKNRPATGTFARSEFWTMTLE